MLLRIIHVHNIINLNFAIPVLIKLLESLQYKSHPVLTHLASNLSNEFLIVDGAISIEVKQGEEVAHVLRAHICLEIAASLLEFCTIQGARIVIIHNTEKSSQTDDALGATLGHFLTESI